MFKSIRIKNFRAITELKIDKLGQVNLLVGQNDCGKTTLLEALFLVIGHANPQLPITVNRIRGLELLSNEYWDLFFHNMKTDSDIEISVALREADEEQELIMRPIMRKKTTVETIPSGLASASSDMVSVGIQNGDSEPGVTPTGLELIYTSASSRLNIWDIAAQQPIYLVQSILNKEVI